MSDWFEVDGFIPHGYCLSWDPDLLAAMVLSNALIALAYLIITIILICKAIEPIPAVPRWLSWSCAAFIFLCGLSHVLDDVTLWVPIYRLQATLLAATGLVSLFAAVMPISVWVTREADRWRR